MIFANNQKSAALDADGVTVRVEGAPTEFYEWGAGATAEKTAAEALAGATAAQEAATAAESKAQEALDALAAFSEDFGYKDGVFTIRNNNYKFQIKLNSGVIAYMKSNGQEIGRIDFNNL